MRHMECPNCKMIYLGSDREKCPRCGWDYTRDFINFSVIGEPVAVKEKYESYLKECSPVKRPQRSITDNEKREGKEYTTIINEDGMEEEVEVVIQYEKKDTKDEYLVYTKNETDNDGNITVYISKVDRTGDQVVLKSVDDEEYADVVKILKELAKDPEE